MSILSDELKNDPQSLGYQQHIDSGNHSQLQQIINEPQYQEIGGRVIRSSELLIWGAQNSRLQKLADAVSDTNNSDQTRSIAQAAIKMIERSDTNLDMNEQQISNMINHLVNQSVFSSQDLTELEQLSTANVSRANQLGLSNVSIQDIRDAVETVKQEQEQESN